MKKNTSPQITDTIAWDNIKKNPQYLCTLIDTHPHIALRIFRKFDANDLLEFIQKTDELKQKPFLLAKLIEASASDKGASEIKDMVPLFFNLLSKIDPINNLGLLENELTAAFEALHLYGVKGEGVKRGLEAIVTYNNNLQSFVELYKDQVNRHLISLGAKELKQNSTVIWKCLLGKDDQTKNYAQKRLNEIFGDYIQLQIFIKNYDQDVDLYLQCLTSVDTKVSEHAINLFNMLDDDGVISLVNKIISDPKRISLLVKYKSDDANYLAKNNVVKVLQSKLDRIQLDKQGHLNKKSKFTISSLTSNDVNEGIMGISLFYNREPAASLLGSLLRHCTAEDIYNVMNTEIPYGDVQEVDENNTNIKFTKQKCNVPFHAFFTMNAENYGYRGTSNYILILKQKTNLKFNIKVKYNEFNKFANLYSDSTFKIYNLFFAAIRNVNKIDDHNAVNCKSMFKPLKRGNTIDSLSVSDYMRLLPPCKKIETGDEEKLFVDLAYDPIMKKLYEGSFNNNGLIVETDLEFKDCLLSNPDLLKIAIEIIGEKVAWENVLKFFWKNLSQALRNTDTSKIPLEKLIGLPALVVNYANKYIDIKKHPEDFQNFIDSSFELYEICYQRLLNQPENKDFDMIQNLIKQLDDFKCFILDHNFETQKDCIFFNKLNLVKDVGIEKNELDLYKIEASLTMLCMARPETILEVLKANPDLIRLALLHKSIISEYFLAKVFFASNESNQNLFRPFLNGALALLSNNDSDAAFVAMRFISLLTVSDRKPVQLYSLDELVEINLNPGNVYIYDLSNDSEWNQYYVKRVWEIEKMKRKKDKTLDFQVIINEHFIKISTRISADKKLSIYKMNTDANNPKSSVIRQLCDYYNRNDMMNDMYNLFEKLSNEEIMSLCMLIEAPALNNLYMSNMNRTSVFSNAKNYLMSINMNHNHVNMVSAFFSHGLYKNEFNENVQTDIINICKKYFADNPNGWIEVLEANIIVISTYLDRSKMGNDYVDVYLSNLTDLIIESLDIILTSESRKPELEIALIKMLRVQGMQKLRASKSDLFYSINQKYAEHISQWYPFAGFAAPAETLHKYGTIQSQIEFFQNYKARGVTPEGIEYFIGHFEVFQQSITIGNGTDCQFEHFCFIDPNYLPNILERYPSLLDTLQSYIEKNPQNNMAYRAYEHVYRNIFSNDEQQRLRLAQQIVKTLISKGSYEVLEIFVKKLSCEELFNLSPSVATAILQGLVVRYKFLTNNDQFNEREQLSITLNSLLGNILKPMLVDSSENDFKAFKTVINAQQGELLECLVYAMPASYDILKDIIQAFKDNLPKSHFTGWDEKEPRDVVDIFLKLYTLVKNDPSISNNAYQLVSDLSSILSSDAHKIALIPNLKEWNPNQASSSNNIYTVTPSDPPPTYSVPSAPPSLETEQANTVSTRNTLLHILARQRLDNQQLNKKVDGLEDEVKELEDKVNNMSKDEKLNNVQELQDAIKKAEMHNQLISNRINKLKNQLNNMNGQEVKNNL